MSFPWSIPIRPRSVSPRGSNGSVGLGFQSCLQQLLLFAQLLPGIDVRALKTYRFNNETKGIEWEFYGNILMLEIQLGMYMSDCENPRFTERTSTNLGRSHRLPHVCTIMIYCKLGGYRFQEAAAFIYTYIYVMNYE